MNDTAKHDPVLPGFKLQPLNGQITQFAQFQHHTTEFPPIAWMHGKIRVVQQLAIGM
jgi:hypothetical protein